MPLLWAVVIGLTSGYLCGGRIAHLGRLHLHGLWLLLPPLILQLLIFPLGSRGPLLSFGVPYWHILSYLFLLAFTIWNWRYPELLLMGFGLLLNLAVIAANGGCMPASAEALRQAGFSSVAQALEAETCQGNTVLMSAKTRLNFLGDWLFLPAWVPLSSAFSLGDVLLGIGAAAFLTRRMVRP
ncbi:MAG: DUF5317 domain-containing protein [Candidatus Bipolaricaulaceae bacterium]